MSDSENSLELSLPARLEGLLFVAAEPVASAQLAAALDMNVTVIEKALDELGEQLRTRGLHLQRHSGRFQLTTAPELAESVEGFLGLGGTSRLSRAALEALAIVAYQQPVTRPGVDAVRGVNSDGVIKSLLSK